MPLFGIHVGEIFGEQREKYLKLLTGACLQASNSTAADILARATR